MELKNTVVVALLAVLWGAAPLAAAQDKFAEYAFALLQNDAIGKLQYDMGKAAAFKIIGGKPVLGEIVRSEMDGEMHQSASFTQAGIELGLISGEKTDPQTLNSITVTAPCTLSTKRGIHIGSTEAEAIAAYREEYSTEESTPGSDVVLGTSHGGLYLKIEAGKVALMYIGASAD